MDPPVLHTFVERLRADERLTRFAAALPTRARVAEPALPLLLAALHEELGRGLCVLLPEDTDARDVAEAVGWFGGEDRVARARRSRTRRARVRIRARSRRARPAGERAAGPDLRRPR
jgi:hypothetical protein